MKEEWRDIDGYPGYQVSNRGNVRSFWQKKKRFGSWGGTERKMVDTPMEISQSDDGNGYLKVYLQNNERRTCKKVHRLVAEAFIPKEEGKDTVDHIRSGPAGKLNNCVENLRWLSRRENIQKAYSDGVCDERIRNSHKQVVVDDSWSGESKTYYSLGEAANFLGLHYTTISHAIKNDSVMKNRYTAHFASIDERLPVWDGEEWV